jgi:hypothetical protein
MSTPDPPRASWTASSLAVCLVSTIPRAAEAAPAPASTAAAPTISESLGRGDLDAALGRAIADREARSQDAGAWGAEAEVRELRGELPAAREARRKQLELLPPKAAERADAEAALRRLDDRARGTVADEPASTHRAELDARRAPPMPKQVAPTRPPADDTKRPKDRIVKKWYFWVTLAAIGAAAATITGVAVKAATAGSSDALDVQTAPHGPAATTLVGF